jgi:hypothetical protein
MNDIVILLVSLVNLLFLNTPRQEFFESIEVKKVNKNIKIDGFLKNEEWSSIDSIVGLKSPWTSNDYDQTIFKYFYTKDIFYFSFNVVDKTIIVYDSKDELTVAKGDRVELFFSASSDLNQYFCIEIAPNGHILDYSAQYYRKFDESWNFKQLNVATQSTSQGYTVEGSISLSELSQLGIGDSFYLGVFRADFRSGNMDDVVWYSRIDPKRKEPDFHIPETFDFFNFAK